MMEQRVGNVARRTVLGPRVLRYAAAAAAVLGAFTLVPGSATSASATSLDAGRHPAAKPKFSNGNATAIGQGFQFAPRAGGLSATIALGTTIADYRDTLAQAETQPIDLGVIGTTLTTACDSSAPPLKPKQLPQPLIAESTDGNAHATRTAAGQSSGGFAAAASQATVAVTTLPKADATYHGNALSIPGVLSVSGIATTAHSELIPGKARLATATSEIGQMTFGPGLIALHNLTWSATQRTGSHPAKKTTFSIGSATVAGKSVPADTKSANALFTSINKLLALSGLHITPPERKTTGGVLAMTPMLIGIDDSKLGAAILNPAMSAIQTENDTIQAALEKLSCKTGSLFSVTDLLIGGLDGSGGIDVKLGGASATTEAVNFHNPFGHQPQLGNGGKGNNGNNGNQPSTPPSSGGQPSTGTPGGSGPSLPSGPGTTTGPTDGGAGSPTIAGQQVVSESCATTSPADRPNCSRGQGLAVGLIALGALGALGGSDFYISRRRRRVPRQPLTL